MALDIFTTALGTLFSRFGAAIKASLLPMILMFVVVLGFAYSADLMISGQFSTGSSPIVFLILGLIIIFPFTLFCFSWVAVLWHRAAILDLDPGFIPNFRNINVPAYAGRLIILGLIILASLIPIALVGGVIGSIFGVSEFNSGVVGLTVAGTILNFVFGIIVSFIWLRISATLPGIALGRRIGISEGWSQTKDLAGPIFGVACILTVLNIMISAALLALSFSNVIVSQLIQIPVSWFTLMLGMSLMTEIYKRSMHIDAAADVFE